VLTSSYVMKRVKVPTINEIATTRTY